MDLHVARTPNGEFIDTLKYINVSSPTEAG